MRPDMDWQVCKSQICFSKIWKGGEFRDFIQGRAISWIGLRPFKELRFKTPEFKLLTMLRDRADICSQVKITVVRTGLNTLTGLFANKLVLHVACVGFSCTDAIAGEIKHMIIVTLGPSWPSEKSKIVSAVKRIFGADTGCPRGLTSADWKDLYFVSIQNYRQKKLQNLTSSWISRSTGQLTVYYCLAPESRENLLWYVSTLNSSWNSL